MKRRLGRQRDRGNFAAVQVFAEGPGDVPDNDDGVRQVVLAPGATHSAGDKNSPAVALAWRTASSIGRCTVPVMMTGANSSTDRWRYQHARRTAGVARTRGDRPRADG